LTGIAIALAMESRQRTNLLVVVVIFLVIPFAALQKSASNLRNARFSILNWVTCAGTAVASVVMLMGTALAFYAAYIGADTPLEDNPYVNAVLCYVFIKGCFLLIGTATCLSAKNALLMIEHRQNKARDLRDAWRSTEST